LPRAASGYNAGAQSSGQPWPSDRSPWRMRENAGYISKTVAAANTALRELAAVPKVPAPPRAGRTQTEETLMAGVLLLKLLRWM